MSKKGVLKWDLEQIQRTRRDLLFFDELYYDPYLLKLKTKWLNIMSSAYKFDNNVVERINDHVHFLEKKKILKQFRLKDFFDQKKKLRNVSPEEVKNALNLASNYDNWHKELTNKIDHTLELLSSKSDDKFRDGLLAATTVANEQDIFSEYYIRLSSLFLEKNKEDTSFTPLVNELVGGEERKTQVIHITINHLPVPDEEVPFDEIIDFRTENRRQYLGLTNWINKVVSASTSVNEIKDEIEYYTLEFEHRLKLEKQKYKLTRQEIVISSPFHITEKLLKLQWSKVLKPYFDIRKNKLSLLTGEASAPGKEMAYICKAKEKFEPSPQKKWFQRLFRKNR